jgi:hypothetical protein
MAHRTKVVSFARADPDTYAQRRSRDKERAMIHRRQVLFLLAATGVRMSAATPAYAQPSADQVLSDMHLSAGDRRKVLAGEFVTADVPSVSERDLSFAIAFLVKTSPAALGKQVMSGNLVTADSQVQSWGELKGTGSAADFARLKITADEAKALSKAKPGDALNLSADEVAALKSAGGSADAVLEALRKILLARHQAYRTSGLAGIAPYDRGSGRTTDHGADLRKASESSAGLKKYVPAFQATLLNYPKASVPQMQESFFWVKSIIEKKPTYILTHLMAAPENSAYALVRRQYYASTNYNGEQSVAGFLPVPDGTVVVLASHAFTDQVTGVGGSLKRSIGSGVMARKMREIFDAGRKRVTS